LSVMVLGRAKTGTALSRRCSTARFCPRDRRGAVEIPCANATFLQSKVKAANPTVELLKPSHRVLIMEKMQTADIATPATSAQPQDRKSNATGRLSIASAIHWLQFPYGARAMCAYIQPLHWSEGCPRPSITMRGWRMSCARPRAIKIQPNSKRNTSLP